MSGIWKEGEGDKEGGKEGDKEGDKEGEGSNKINPDR